MKAFLINIVMGAKPVIISKVYSTESINNKQSITIGNDHPDR